MSIGVCYFPEHWPREQWERDVERMAEAGIEYVRMGEFAWSKLEPEPGTYDFEWLEEAVELVGEHGMQAVLCTPTAAPPKWLVDEHPDILQEDSDGTVREFGSRRHYCFNSPTYRRESRRIVTALATHFADDPHVVGWQTDNEYGCHGTLSCTCEDCATAFREWLREEYESIEDLNESWGNAFWSQEYPSFAAVDPPKRTPTDHHPSRRLDYARFTNDAVVDYNAMQVSLLREASGDWFVTHNYMSHFGGLNAFDATESMDFASWDSYPTGHTQLQKGEDATETEVRVGDPDVTGINHDLYAGAGDGTFWVMEQQPGGVNWPPHPTEPAEGAMRLWAHHAVAHGASVVSYFRWRRCRFGQEQYHAGLCRQTGEPDRGYHDAKRAAEELEALDADDLDAPEGEVALVHDYESLWGVGIEPASEDFDYWALLRTYYRALRERSVPVDVVPPEADLDAYDAVVAPTLYVADDDLAARYEDYVANGGTLLLSVRSGFKDPHDKLTDGQPGPFTELVGATVDQHEGFRLDDDSRVTYDGETYDFRTWAEWLDPEAATADGEFLSGTGAGNPAVVTNNYGEGAATYAGVWPESDLAGALVEDLLDRAVIDHTDPMPEGVRVSPRDGLCWVSNFSGEPYELSVPEGAEWRLGGGTLEPFGVSVVAADYADIGVRKR